MSLHFDLNTVGLLASLTQALAQQGIPMNAISDYYHDHLFVPWDLRPTALGIFALLSQTSP